MIIEELCFRVIVRIGIKLNKITFPLWENGSGVDEVV
jgi:hypothetical protein